MANGPAEGIEDMPLHLREHLFVVERAAHGLELADEGDALLLVAILGSDQEGCAADQLIVALVDDAARAVPVEKVDSQEEGLRKELEGGVSLDQKVDEIGSHEPLDLLLYVNGSHIR